MSITVANIRTTKDGVYIGRAMPRQGLKGSPLGNPFRLDNGDNRDEVLHQYAQFLGYILERGEEGLNASGHAIIHEIERLTELARHGDLVLLCWCKENGVGPACHGDVIKEIIEQRLETTTMTELDTTHDQAGDDRDALIEELLAALERLLHLSESRVWAGPGTLAQVHAAIAKAKQVTR